MNEAITTSALVGALAPLGIAVLNRWDSRPNTKRLVSLLVAAVIGGVATALSPGFSWGELGTAVLTAVGASQAAFALLWKPTGVKDVVEYHT